MKNLKSKEILKVVIITVTCIIGLSIILLVTGRAIHSWNAASSKQQQQIEKTSSSEDRYIEDVRGNYMHLQKRNIYTFGNKRYIFNKVKDDTIYLYEIDLHEGHFHVNKDKQQSLISSYLLHSTSMKKQTAFVIEECSESECMGEVFLK